MITIGIHFSDPNPEGAPFNIPEYRESYQLFGEFLKQKNARLIILRGQSYLGNMRFENTYEFLGKELVPIAEEVVCDVVYRKSRIVLPLERKTDNFRNSREFEDFLSDKWQTYQAFSEFSPKTIFLSKEKSEEIHELRTEKVVVKPVDGFGGNDIFLINKKDISGLLLDPAQTYLAQEFIDSSVGIPGIITEAHDLRIVFYDKQPICSFLRTPAKDDFISNVSHGGGLIVVDIKHIPTMIWEMTDAINHKLDFEGHRFFSIDLFCDAERPYLIEFNSQPGFPLLDMHGEKYTDQYFKSLFTFLTAL